MSNEQNYRPRSPDLPAFGNQPHPPPRLQRLPSYTIQEPSLPKDYSFSPRGSYDASPFFSPVSQQPAASYFAQLPITSPQAASSSLPSQQQSQQQPPPEQQSSPTQAQPFSSQTFNAAFTHSPPRISQVSSLSGPSTTYYASGLAHNQQAHQPYHQPLQSYHEDEMARLRQRKPVNYNENHNGATDYGQTQSYPPAPPPSAMMNSTPILQQPFHQSMQSIQPIQPMQSMPPMPAASQPDIATGPLVLPKVDVKTKFPVARIKRIMQADEDVGKVAQATPSAVSKALELFMIALVTKGASEAKSQNSKRVTATHLKSALLKDPQFDFLNDICESVPDEGSKKRAKSETKDSDSEDEAVENKKKSKPRKKKAGSEVESD